MKKQLSILVMAIVAVMVAFASCGNSSEAKLEKEIEKANKSCPVTVAQGIRIVKFSQNDKDLVADFEINERLYDMEMLKSHGDEMKGEMSQVMLSGKSGKALKELLKECNKGVELRMKGKNSKEVVTINLPVPE